MSKEEKELTTLMLPLEDGGELPVYVLEQTTVGGRNYYLVTEQAEGDADAMILKDMSASEDEEAILEIVEDDAEFDALLDIFSKLMEDTADIQKA